MVMGLIFYTNQVIFSQNLMGESPVLEIIQLDTGVTPSVSNSRLKPLQFQWPHGKYFTLASNNVVEKQIAICTFSTMWYYRNQNKRTLNKKIHLFVFFQFLTQCLKMEGWREKYYAVEPLKHVCLSSSYMYLMGETKTSLNFYVLSTVTVLSCIFIWNQSLL